ncbi:SpoIIE family protein phosphatase [Streptomyces sp. PSKA54]|uniref:SpoIIE family protein phosphatase n=1 Tax=Streptomyces himalayensis subsp. aureolus TaxID=2758039 RepID=A0A7W2HK11_9ACTN|nr:SpoIIE family protein phosphatase [Streptomyces himalayensis subsp. aureolus]
MERHAHVLGRSRAAVSALVAPLIAALALVPFRTTFPSNDAALVLVAVVVAVAAQGDRIAGLIAAVSATVWLDFFLIHPWFTLSITGAEDRWTVILLLVIGAAVSELAIRGRRQRERAQAAHGRLDLLHDAGMAIGASLDVERTAQELARVAVPRFADFVTVDLAVFVLRGEEPAVHGTEMRRVAVAGIRDDHPFHPVGELVTTAVSAPRARSLLRSGRARIEPDLRASTAWRSLVLDHAGPVLGYGIHSLITAPLRARGVPLGVVSFWRAGGAEPFEVRDLSDAEELAAKAAVAIDNARRYTRERATALALQRSLLPQRLPRQTAVEVAFRYLPAGSQAGVGGDWFDVIPLSGSRVALIVGDVVGHGINASATMGRLRTAVRTLADVDLPPDELLTHLDDLVIRLTGDEQTGTAEGDVAAAGELGATCLYAVYDPVSRRCALASAGHPLPALRTPDGAVESVSGFVGPPLGLGGLPFETTELTLPASSVLALYSDGLVKSRERDFDEGLDTLLDALAVRTPSLDAACDTVIQRLVTDRPADDVALLLARTRVLASDRVAIWDIPADPSLVERTRKVAVEQLDQWGLTDATFTTELLVSELVTNAIRYGDSPIQLRLIRDATLICEVSDASSTAPHLRRARVYDEGGRGLLLVSQLSQSWGTRHATVGKTIWCEQKLPTG